MLLLLDVYWVTINWIEK